MISCNHCGSTIKAEEAINYIEMEKAGEGEDGQTHVRLTGTILHFCAECDELSHE